MQKRKSILLVAAISLTVALGCLAAGGDDGVRLKAQREEMVVWRLLGQTVAWEADLYNLESNNGVVIYDDGQCQMRVANFERDISGVYRLTLLSNKGLTADGWRRVSVLIDDDFAEAVSLDVLVGDTRYHSDKLQWRATGTNDAGELEITLEIFPLDCFWRGELLIADEVAAVDGRITLVLEGVAEERRIAPIVW